MHTRPSHPRWIRLGVPTLVLAGALSTSTWGAAHPDACGEIMPPDLSRFDLHMKTSNTYGDPELGRGTTYVDSGQLLRWSIYTYDLGRQTISMDFQESVLMRSLQDMYDTQEQFGVTYGDAYQLPENYFSAMNTSLNLGLFAQSVVTQNPEQMYDELLAIGDYKNCIIKVRLSIPTPMNAQYGDGDPYRLFYGLSKFMFVQLANNAVIQP